MVSAVGIVKAELVDDEGTSEMVNLIKSAYSVDYDIEPDPIDGRLDREERYRYLRGALAKWVNDGTLG